MGWFRCRCAGRRRNKKTAIAKRQPWSLVSFEMASTRPRDEFLVRLGRAQISSWGVSELTRRRRNRIPNSDTRNTSKIGNRRVPNPRTSTAGPEGTLRGCGFLVFGSEICLAQQPTSLSCPLSRCRSRNACAPRRQLPWANCPTGFARKTRAAPPATSLHHNAPRPYRHKRAKSFIFAHRAPCEIEVGVFPNAGCDPKLESRL